MLQYSFGFLIKVDCDVRCFGMILSFLVTVKVFLTKILLRIRDSWAIRDVLGCFGMLWDAPTDRSESGSLRELFGRLTLYICTKSRVISFSVYILFINLSVILALFVAFSLGRYLENTKYVLRML